MGTSSSKNKRKTSSGKDRLAGVKRGTNDSGRERKRSLSKKSALGWTNKAVPVLTSEKTVVWERQKKASKSLAETLSTSLRYSDFTRVDRKKSLETDDLKPMYIPYDSSEVFQNEPDDLCHICSVYTGGVLFTCKVCLHVYHESCLKKIGQDGNTAKFRTDGHWSCHTCDDVSSLLTEEEMTRLCQTFEKYNIIKGRDLLHTEILAFWKQQFLDKVASGMDLDTERRLVDVICKMDPEQRGIVAWKNFMDHEALKILNKRNKNSLLRLLTESEIRKIRNKFKLFDYNKQGFIMKDNALALLITSEAFYCVQDCGSGPTLSAHGSESQVNWQQFVMMQAIYSIAARLNVWQNSNENTDHQDNTNIKDPVLNSRHTVCDTRNTKSHTEVQMHDVGDKIRDAGVPVRETGNTAHTAGDPIFDSRASLRNTGVLMRNTRLVKSDTGNKMCNKEKSVRITGVSLRNPEDKQVSSGAPIRKTGEQADPKKDLMTDSNVSDSKTTSPFITDPKLNRISASKAVNTNRHSNTEGSLSKDNTKSEMGDPENKNTKKSSEMSCENSPISAVCKKMEENKNLGQENEANQTAAPSSCVITTVTEQAKKSLQSEVVLTQVRSTIPVGNNDVEKRVVGNNNAEKRDAGNKDTEKRDAGNKDIEKRAAGNNDVEKGAAGNNDVANSAVGNNDVKKRASSTSNMQTTPKYRLSKCQDIINKTNAESTIAQKLYRSISNGKDTARAQQTFTEKAQIEFIKCSSAHRATKSLYVLKGTSGRQGHINLRRPVSMA